MKAGFITDIIAHAKADDSDASPKHNRRWCRNWRKLDRKRNRNRTLSIGINIIRRRIIIKSIGVSIRC